MMKSQQVADMTVEELKDLIRQVVQEQLSNHRTATKDPRSVQEILQSIKQHRWTPPPGAPTASQMIIEERDR